MPLKSLLRNHFPGLANALRLNARYRKQIYGVHPDGFQPSVNIDQNGNPIPWYTYPAIEFLSGSPSPAKTSGNLAAETPRPGGLHAPIGALCRVGYRVVPDCEPRTGSEGASWGGVACRWGLTRGPAACSH